jgi:glycosyltransferase involved in cell wall biosynthesis
MENKIKVLFYNLDGAGVNYFRTLTPATEIERNHSDEFQVEINSQIDFNNPNTLDYLKSFNIIHYHRQLHPDVRMMQQLANELRKNGTVLIVDIDDYWELHKKHPLYGLSLEKKMYIPIIQNLKIADYVTTTTEAFVEEIRKVTGKDNVIALYNSIDPEWMKQFQNNWKPDPDGKVRIVYAAGSSHLGDIEQLENAFNVLSNDFEIKDKFKVILAGFDCEGTTTDISFNEEFKKELERIRLWTPDMIKSINKSRGNIDLIPKLPDAVREKFRNNIFLVNERPIKSEESVYYTYEKILTDNHKMVQDKDYVEWLLNFERNINYPHEVNYCRRWTQKANIYAKVLDEADIVIAPLADNKFNSMKSSLKQIECWTRKLPIVCSNVVPYNVDGRHMENCMLVPNEKNAHKYWGKYLKKLILDADLRKKLGEQLYEDFHEKYHLANVTKTRTDFYRTILPVSRENVDRLKQLVVETEK